MAGLDQNQYTIIILIHVKLSANVLAGHQDSNIIPWTQFLTIASVSLSFFLLPCYKWAPLILA